MNFGSFVSNERYKDQGIDAGYAASRCDRLWRWQCVDPGYGKEFVTKKLYVTKEEYDEAVLAASITPGALPVEIACGIGRKYGRACMLLAASLVALPGAVATVALLAMMEHIDEQTIRWLSVFTKAVSLF